MNDTSEVVVNEIVVEETVSTGRRRKRHRSSNNDSETRALDLQELVKRLAAREAGLANDPQPTNVATNQNPPQIPTPVEEATTTIVYTEESGSKSYYCSLCNHVFSCRKNMMRHQIIHSGVMPHQCRLCNKSFNRSDALKRHMKTHDIQRIAKMGSRNAQDIVNLKNLEEGEVIIRENGKPLICHKMTTDEAEEASYYLTEHDPSEPMTSFHLSEKYPVSQYSTIKTDPGEVIRQTINQAEIDDMNEKKILKIKGQQRVADMHVEAGMVSDGSDDERRKAGGGKTQHKRWSRRRRKHLLNRGFPSELIPEKTESDKRGKLATVNILNPRRELRNRGPEKRSLERDLLELKMGCK